MGIQGLLPLLKSIQKPTHLRNFAGQTLGVDAYGWLHRGTVACAIELAQQKPTRKHIDFALGRVRMLIHFGVKPYLVFDGASLPSKEHTEKERATRRKESKKLGLELLAMGRVSQAYLELQKAIDVTPLMARELIDELKILNVPYIVAPYEADSQLAYLERQGLISGVLSEDSDLLVFGVKCLLTKLDQYGECVMVNRADFTACRDLSLVGWTDKEFRIMAMLSGCDYLPGIPNMGLKTAYRLVQKHKEVQRLIRALQFDGKKKVPADYLEAFDRAEKTFLYQWVFCPTEQCLVNLTTLPAELLAEDMPFIGAAAEADVASGVAAGDLDPNTKERLVVSALSRQHSVTRAQSLATPDEKPSKPITEFFKPKRTPLAELDPNSFTPSPSQYALLQSQQGASWSASQAQPLRSSLLARASLSNAPASAPQPPRRTISDHLADSGRRSPKRQRLCSDSTLASAMKGNIYEETTTSRFFNPSKTEPSPSLRKPSAHKKRMDDFELWSDDPAAEAVAEMMPVTETENALTTKAKKLKVFVDPQIDTASSLRSVNESQDTSASNETQMSSRDLNEEDTPLTSFESEPSATKRNIFTPGIDADFAALKTKFSFTSSTPRKPPTRVQSTPLTARSSLAGAEHNQLLGRLSKRQPNTTPLDIQRLGARRKEEVSEPAVIVPRSSPQLTPTKRCDGEEDNFISDQEWLELEQREVSPPTNLLVQGSEDLLVPNSPESGENSESGRKRPVFNLDRFAFGGHC